MMRNRLVPHTRFHPVGAPHLPGFGRLGLSDTVVVCWVPHSSRPLGRVAKALDLTGITKKRGCPILRALCEGWVAD